MAEKILLIIAHNGFQPIEYTVPKQMLEQAGMQVCTASDKKGQAVASDGSKATVDYTLEEVKVEDFDGIFIIGGRGAMEHLDNTRMHEIIRSADKVNMVYGAICISPRILAHAGVLEWRRVTGWDEDNNLAALLKEVGAEYILTGVVVDDNIITATGPSVAQDFGQAIIDTVRNPFIKAAELD